MNNTDGTQTSYNHLEVVETGICNLTKCVDGIVEEEFKHSYMVYCEITDPEYNCQVSKKLRQLKNVENGCFTKLSPQKRFWHNLSKECPVGLELCAPISIIELARYILLI